MPFGGALIMAGGSMLANVAGSIIANNAAGEERERAQAAINAAIGEINKVGAPPELWQPIILNQMRQVGIYNPQLEDAISVGISQASQAQSDLEGKQSQISALKEMRRRSQGGLTPEDEAAFNKMRLQVAADVQGKLGAITQEYQARGIAGAGTELAAKLSAAQAGTERLSQQGMDIAAARTQATQAALAQMGALGGQIRGQEFGEQFQRGTAADTFRQFDVQNSINRQMRNVQAAQQAQLTNLNTAQQIANANVNMQNQELYRQAQAKEQNWQNQLALAQARAGARLGMVGPAMQAAQQKAQMISGIGAGVGQAFGAMGGFFGQQYAQDRADARQQQYLDRAYPQSGSQGWGGYEKTANINPNTGAPYGANQYGPSLAKPGEQGFIGPLNK